MNRDLKFRAWDKIENIMHYQENGNEGVEFSFGGINCVKVYEYKPQLVDGVCIDDWDYEELEDVEIMQYTGLRDKNGKEIYESDIIQTDVNLKKWIVYEEDYAWYVKNIGSNEKYPLGVYKKLISVASSKLEVIGNIYQNKNLLNI